MAELSRACKPAKAKVNPKTKRAAQETAALTRAPKLLRAATALLRL